MLFKSLNNYNVYSPSRSKCEFMATRWLEKEDVDNEKYVKRKYIQEIQESIKKKRKKLYDFL